MTMDIKIPQLSLVVLIGASGSGKSTFARTHFLETEVISSDRCRAIVSDDETDQRATDDAFDLLFYIVRKRLKAGRLTVIDATNVRPDARKPLIRLAREFHVLPVAIVLDLPAKVCKARNDARSDRNLPPHVIPQQRAQLRRSFRGLRKEGFRVIYKIESQEQADGFTLKREPLWSDKSHLTGPFDIIGDVHGCYDELTLLLEKLGYQPAGSGIDGPMSGPLFSHPEGRTAVFLGDIVDRGPRILDCLKLVYNMVKGAGALCVPGNHDMKFLRKLKGRNVQLTHGLTQSMAEIEALPEDVREPFVNEAQSFVNSLISHYVLDNRRLVVAHAGLKEEMQGRGSQKVRDFCYFGETTGETDEFGLPVRHNWAAEYRGSAIVVYGHTPAPEPEWLNRTVNIDTGCVFGGKLTALRYPEKEFVSVPAKTVYCEPVKPLGKAVEPVDVLSLQQQYDGLLDAQDVLGKSIISTRLRPNISVREENAAAALEVMSRYAVNPKWLIYLPPTMSPCETSRKEGYLESPEEAFEYFRANGVPNVICQEKHMGSRAVVVVCRDESAAQERFGVKDEGIGMVYTRTGRRFFNDEALETAFLTRVRDALDRAGAWQEFGSQWFCLDCELMPWSEKAKELLRTQYAAVGAAAAVSLQDSVKVLETTLQRTDLETDFEFPEGSGSEELDIRRLLDKVRERSTMVSGYIDAYRQYCWPVTGLDDYKLAPFHLLAGEGKVYTDKDHEWHMTTLAGICSKDPGLLLATPYRVIDVTDDSQVGEGIAWWEELTGKGGEGMVVKPLDFIARGKRGLVQPALKCRGKEYLRIIYGPEYTYPDYLARLRSRALGGKRSLALREFALGIEALERFIAKEPLRLIHQCVFAILALESEPIDPRL
jgi:protein phosphatase